MFTQTTHDILAYAKSEATRLLRKLTQEPSAAHPLEISVDTALQPQEIAVVSDAKSATLRGGSPAAALHAVYTFFGELGCVFESSGEVLPQRQATIRFPKLNLRHVPSFPERGIRMHLNFVQDQSYFSEEEFAAFIDNMARQRFNYLMFHMYTPQQWFPFTYRGVAHLDQQLGFKRKPLPSDMIGRGKVKVKRHWFPREFEPLSDDPAALLDAMHQRYQRMMARAHARGIRNCVSFEPEALPPALEQKLGEWTGENAAQLLANQDLNQDWQEGWSGAKLVEADVRHPLVIDISVERVLQCLAAFPDLDEIQLISREGTKWTPKAGQGESFDGERARLAKKFRLTPEELNASRLAAVEPADVGPEMMPQARPYWTVLPGENYYATTLGSLRFVEHALAVLQDPRVRAALDERGIESCIAVYSPHPETVRQMMPAIAKMLPKGTRFHCLSDYGARDIAANLPAWKPLVERGHIPGVITWLEFDGIMALAQGWCDSLIENIQKAAALEAQNISFNHWRVRSLEHNAQVAAAFTWDAAQSPAAFKKAWLTRLFGAKAVNAAKRAYAALETATLFTKTNGYNVGFAGDWVYRTSTNPPGYYWPRLLKMEDLYMDASNAFEALAANAVDADGKPLPAQKQAEYLRELCSISAMHVRAVYHLQNAKLPLVGYKAWPLGNPNAAWPHPAALALLLAEADEALALQRSYMKIYARWVKTADEQGQLCSHQQGVIDPYTHFVETLEKQLEIEENRIDWLESPLKNPSDVQPV